jgi:hypothetical protein
MVFGPWGRGIVATQVIGIVRGGKRGAIIKSGGYEIG